MSSKIEVSRELLERLARNLASGSEAYKAQEDLCELLAAPVVERQPVAQKYDDTLLPFLALMRKELHTNDGKGDRPGWLAMDSDTCLLEIIYHFGKLQASVKRGDGDGINEYAADVANMCMMLTDICGSLVYVEITVPPELAELQATIALLRREQSNDLIAYKSAIEKQNELRAEIERLKGGQGEAVVLPFRGLPYGTKFRYQGSSEVWVRTQHNVIAAWSGKVADQPRQSLCCFCHIDGDEDGNTLDTLVEVLNQ